MNFLKIFIYSSILIGLIFGCRPEREKPLENYLVPYLIWSRLNTPKESPTGTNEFDNLKTYYSTMKKLELQIVYETGAEPFAGTFTNPATLSTKTTWQIFEDNLNQIFTYRGQSMSFTIPKEISSMQSIGAGTKSAWTVNDLLNLAKTYRTNKSTSDTGRFFVAFLNGYYSENGTSNQNVIGLNVSGTPYLFIFKQVINSVSAGTTPVTTATRVYVEQSTMVHEMGHALGLVNNGVPITTSHHDSANGAHCTNTTCVMFYANSGTAALVTFLQSYLTSGSNLMVKTDCLDDIKAYK